MASEWDKFIVAPRDALAEARLGGDVTGASRAADTDRIVVPELVVTLEVLLDVKDIAVLDIVELWQLKIALTRVDRDASIASWPRAEPAAVTEWRLGVLGRTRRSGVAAAILHALEPYHALVCLAIPTLPIVTVRLPAARVSTIRCHAIMMAWFEHMKDIVARDAAEHGAWHRYWTTMTSPMGTQEHSIRWQGGVKERAEAGSEVAGRVADSIRQRDEAMAAIDRAAAHRDIIVVRVPGATDDTPPARPAA